MGTILKNRCEKRYGFMLVPQADNEFVSRKSGTHELRNPVNPVDPG